MNNIKTLNELRNEIQRVRQLSDMQKTAIHSSYANFKNSLTPVNIVMSILAELNYDKLFNSAAGIINKVRSYFKS